MAVYEQEMQIYKNRMDDQRKIEVLNKKRKAEEEEKELKRAKRRVTPKQVFATCRKTLGLGSGVKFDALQPSQMQLLERIACDLTKERRAALEPPPPPPPPRRVGAERCGAVLLRPARIFSTSVGRRERRRGVQQQCLQARGGDAGASGVEAFGNCGCGAWKPHFFAHEGGWWRNGVE